MDVSGLVTYVYETFSGIIRCTWYSSTANSVTSILILYNVLRGMSTDRHRTPRTYASGHAKRQKLAAEKEAVKCLKGSLDKFVVNTVAQAETANTSAAADAVDPIAETSQPQLSPRQLSTPSTSSNDGDDLDIADPTSPASHSSNTEPPSQLGAGATVDYSDPANWPSSLTPQTVSTIVRFGPRRIFEFDFPLDDGNRKFTTDNYFRKLKNGERVERTWLVYSVSSNSLFCFCCKLFGNSGMKLTDSGYSAWQYMSKTLQAHEISPKHRDCMERWKELCSSLSGGKTLDYQLQRQIENEKMHWRNVLERLISIIHFLAERNLAFLGTSHKLYEKNNGNFLGQVELMAKYDSVLGEHLRRIKDGEIHDHYLGPTIQNEFIGLLGQRLLNEIVARAKSAKYFSVILDCTSDISHKEQLSVILRFVLAANGNKPKICEHFLSFFVVDDTTGQGLADTLLNLIDGYGLSLEDCRGQGYDNGSNMKGKNSGVQARIMRINPRAFFVPCYAHSLNLVVADAASSSIDSFSLFGFLQKLYALFSASTHRWTILRKHVKISVKGLSETRWECKISAVKAARFQIKELKAALTEVADQAKGKDAKCYAECIGLMKEISSFRFIVCLEVWYNILYRINGISKVLQSETMQINAAIGLIEGCRAELSAFRDTGFEEAVTVATDLAQESDIMPAFPEARFRRTKRQFGYEAADESIQDPKEQFRVNFFLRLVDVAKTALTERFEQFQTTVMPFAFLFDISGIRDLDDKALQNHCSDLNILLSDALSSDLDATELFEELKVLRHTVPNGSTPLASLDYITCNSLTDAYPNVAIALRILLTMPVTVASAERSFSALKLIKNYLRSTMSQDRLSNLAVISIEHELGRKLDYNAVIDDFAASKSRKVFV